MEEVPGEKPQYDAGVTRHFLTGAELTRGELTALIDRAAELKADRLASDALAGKSVALVFEAPSTRTRVSFEVGVSELGGTPVVLRGDELQLSRGESPRDTAMVLSRFVHAIGIRTGDHAPLEELTEHGSVPVVNMLTRDHHPCQALADVWVSMGDDPGEAASRRAVLEPYRIDDALLAAARDDAIALHCLPAHPGEEITADVLYGPRSAVWDQAENRLHAQKALLELLI